MGTEGSSTSVFADRIRHLRESNGLSVLGFADRLELKTPRTVLRWESGETVATLEMAGKIADEFGVTLDWLGGVADEPTGTAA